MKLYCLYPFTVVLLCLLQHRAPAQDSTAIVSSRYADKVSGRVHVINEKLENTTAKALTRLQKQQDKIKQRLFKVDSAAANNIFGEADQRYKQLQEKLNNPQQLTQYIPFLDTLKTSLNFLGNNKELLSKAGGIDGKLDKSMSEIKGLEDNLQKAEAVKQFLKQQKQYLKDQLEKFGFAKQLKKLNKDVYYYGQQVNEYKETIKDPKKLERKVIDLVSRTKIFQDFMKKNSMLASLFRMPADDPNDPAYLQSMAGLQTRAQVNQFVQDQLGTTGTNGIQQLTANVQQAQGALQQLKDKAAQYGSGSTDEDMPDFKPNTQKTKSFLNRLEVGTNIQTVRSNALLPVTSDLGLSLGYKINDKSVIGIGTGYKLGWGKNIQHIRLSGQGASLRSWVDVRLKKSFWLSGGYEMNYHNEFKSIEQLKDYSAWQPSGLIGLSKKFPVTSRLFKNTKLQLLWDFLSYRQVPRVQPVVFRVGYNIK